MRIQTLLLFALMTPLIAQDAPPPVPLTKEIALARSFKGRHHKIPGNIPSVDFDNGPEGVAYHNIGPIHDPDAKEGVRADGLAYRPAEIEIEIGWGTTQIAATKAGEWMNYSVEVSQDGIYDLEVVASGWKKNGIMSALRIEFDGVDMTGEIEAPETGKWFIFKTVHKKDIALKKGWRNMRVVFTRGDGAMNLADLRFVPARP